MARLAPSARSIRLAIVVACAALVALPQASFAYSCAMPVPTPASASARAVAVFRGTVTSTDNQRSGRTTFRVSTAWKGQVTSEMIVYGGSNNFSNYYQFRQGTEYVIYANRAVTGSAWNAPENSLVADICTRTLPVSQAADDLAFLGPGQPPLPTLPPAVGQGFAAVGASRLILGALVIAGSLGVFLALAWRVRKRSAASSTGQYP